MRRTPSASGRNRSCNPPDAISVGKASLAFGLEAVEYPLSVKLLVLLHPELGLKSRCAGLPLGRRARRTYYTP